MASGPPGVCLDHVFRPATLGNTEAQQILKSSLGPLGARHELGSKFRAPSELRFSLHTSPTASRVPTQTQLGVCSVARSVGTYQEGHDKENGEVGAYLRWGGKGLAVAVDIIG